MAGPAVSAPRLVNGNTREGDVGLRVPGSAREADIIGRIRRGNPGRSKLVQRLVCALRAASALERHLSPDRRFDARCPSQRSLNSAKTSAMPGGAHCARNASTASATGSR